MTTLKKLAADKLLSSGLTLEDAEALGIELLPPPQTKALHPPHSLPALRLVYHDLKGRPRKDIWRTRLLAEPPPGKFGEKPEKPLRYLQPAGSPPGVYLPQSLPWGDIAQDASIELVITEGELKAACACKHGLACLGLGGVSSWRSAKLGWSLLPELEAFTWTKRVATICFDSDAATNPNIATATASLATELSRRGALPRVSRLPGLQGLPKTGLDDYIVRQGAEALQRVLDVADSDELARRLWEFNGRFAFILEPGLVYDEGQDVRYNPSDFRSTLFANEWAVTSTPGPQGAPRLKQVPVASEWIQWEQRRQYRGLTFCPGLPRVVEGKLNAWRGWPVVPKKGDVGPWVRLLDHLFKGADPGARSWFERWCAYPVAFPGAKLSSAVGVWSRGQGQGKSLVGVTLGKVYGEGYSAISQRELESDFNGWALNKQLVMVDDVSSYDSRAKADILKKFITEREMVVNVKYVPTYSVPNCANLYLTSNRANAYYLEDHDRRFFVHEVTVERLPTPFYRAYHKWLDGDGAAALLWHLQHLDFGDFHPHEPPPRTKAKVAMIDNVKSDLGLWLTELKACPDGALRLGGVELRRDVFSVHELLAIFDQHRRGPPITASALGIGLREYFTPLFDGAVMRLVPGCGAARWYAVRNEARWSQATVKQIAAHVAETRTTEQRGF